MFARRCTADAILEENGVSLPSCEVSLCRVHKWDEYGIMLHFRDIDMGPDEPLVEKIGTTMPWAGDMRAPLETVLSPRVPRI